MFRNIWGISEHDYQRDKQKLKSDGFFIGRSFETAAGGYSRRMINWATVKFDGLIRYSLDIYEKCKANGMLTITGKPVFKGMI